jgi:hypothetical protein
MYLFKNDRPYYKNLTVNFTAKMPSRRWLNENKYNYWIWSGWRYRKGWQ